MSSEKNHGRVSGNQWLKAALYRFAKTGEQGLRVETLARDLGIAKGAVFPGARTIS